ncbi:unnamed protein product [Vitrella brassicaformis CCMP3155]|uniref:Ran guanine nucleotide release factor n=2 Tax=Vitrella brassicaformis TaxID=1169539 RepID=A0A0G4FW32_VITBC|nr:unnamed protein product [Vitrella brassicaformis CCMP3155]|mmetsp:Transcript_6893/g.16703  ORF Transcript_6893/g.16703 Transcript_6893/m.16703 type:complete len:201 (+) Transcript_6893:63-665(+)|eukprot:CEM19409.1 unnamed protein product [Vitrella brassicaformis CCMP3155]
MSFREVDLFGGAMRCAIPQSFADVSQIRDVPDNQEVFADFHTDSSLMFEVVQYQQTVTDQDAPRYFFRDLAEVNEADPWEVLQVIRLEPAIMPNLDGSICKYLVMGHQTVSKFREGREAANVVAIYMAIIRLPEHHSEVLISFNDPRCLSPASSSAPASHVGVPNGTSLHDAYSYLNQEGPQQFQSLLETFQIRDWGLFG